MADMLHLALRESFVMATQGQIADAVVAVTGESANREHDYLLLILASLQTS